MINRTSQVLTLPSGEKYFIMKHIMYKGQPYYVTSKTNEEMEDLSEVITLFKVETKDEKDIVTLVTDSNIVSAILNNITIVE